MTPAGPVPAAGGRRPPTTATSGGLDVRYTFDAFVIGSSNRFAHAAAQAVAEMPAKSYNPLFIHGDAGLGKTHLLHAIGNYVRENFAGRRVRYVSTETFLNEFVDAIRTNTTTAFKRRYRECDVLLIDDVQFMENKEALQEEFFHTFNHLYGASRQVVLTSDRAPKSIATLEDRLRSRFLSGLITDVQPPELETRLAILQKKLEREPSHDVPHEVLEFIASNVTDNIRELEGALIRVTAYGSLNNQPLTRELAEHVLSDIVNAGQPRPITPAADPRDHRRRPSGSASTTCAGPAGAGPWSSPARSACTCSGTSPTTPSPPSPGNSGAGTTPPSCTPWRRSPRSCANAARSSTR